MGTLGDSNTPGSGFWFDHISNGRQFWTANQFTMPSPGGLATGMDIYVAGDGGSAAMQFIIWDSSGNIVWNSGSVTAPSGTESVHGQSWVHSSVPNVYLVGGSNYLVGFSCGFFVVWTFESVDGVIRRSPVGGPSSATGGVDEYGGQGFGRLGAYVTYTPLAVPVLNTVTPNVGTAGTVCSLSGTGFVAISSVTFNGTSASSFTVNSSTSITATVASGTPGGLGECRVTNPAGYDHAQFTVGQIYDSISGSSVNAITAVKFGDLSGSGAVHDLTGGIWVPVNPDGSGGVKRIW
jgi:hypothetical protein